MANRNLLRRVAFCGLVAANAVLAWITLALAIGRYDTNNPQIVARLDHGEGRHSVTILSAGYVLDRPYMSMEGPHGNHPQIRLADGEDVHETLWLTGIESEVVDATSHNRLSDEYFCHANLTFNPDTISPEVHNASFEGRTHADWRLFTLVPGRMQMRLPEGFGLPLREETLVDYYSMVLNQNPGPPRRVRVRTVISYSEGDVPMRPLFRRALYVYQQHSPEPKGPESLQLAASSAHQGEQCGEACTVDQTGRTPSSFVGEKAAGLHPGATCCVTNASAGGVVKQFGGQHTVHWMVPPGRHVYRTEVTEQLNLPADTTVHYVTGHLHSFGKRVWLRDLESGETLFEITGKDFEDRLGVASMSEVVSQEGVPIQRDRRYELVAEYVNPGDSEIDAMAILYLYALDQL